MTMPNNLYLVRHGESEWNVVNRRSQRGDDSLFSDEVRKRHTSSWRLTDKGCEQARAAGEWLAANAPPAFGRYYVSDYVRAKETAVLLNLADANWYVDYYLRERDWGDLEVTTQTEKREQFAKSMRLKEAHPFFWRPPNGESMADACLRADRVLDTLHRECEDMDVILVLHGEMMWAFRARIERISPTRFVELSRSRDPLDRIHNCQIIQYSRIHPHAERYSLMRSVCPWDSARSQNAWNPIVRSRFSNEDLEREVNAVSRILPLP